MVGSIDSLDFSPELIICEERIAIPLKCWQDVCLSDVWIPSPLLPSRKQPSNSRITKGIFHILEKKDARKCIESFRVYSEEELFFSDSDEDCKDIGKCGESLPENLLAANGFSDTNTEIQNMYDNKNDINGKSNQHENKIYEYLEKRSSAMKTMPSLGNLCNIDTETNIGDINTEIPNIDDNNKIVIDDKSNQHDSESKIYEYLERKSGMKTMPSFGNLCNIDDETNIGVNCLKTVNIKSEQCKESTITKEESQNDSLISLHDILDNTPLFNINDFKTKDVEFLGNQEIKLETYQKQNKKKKKASKYISLGEFRKDYEEADYQEACCNDYFKKLLNQKNKGDGAQILNAAEFPDLVPKGIKIIHPKIFETEKSTDSNVKMPEVPSPSIEVTDHSNADHDEKVATSSLENEKMYGKLVIENIPNEVDEYDIHSILCGYGEIKSFSLQSTGKFFKANIEMELQHPIDWIIDCLNGTEPFGASTTPLKCYQQD